LHLTNLYLLFFYRQRLGRNTFRFLHKVVGTLPLLFVKMDTRDSLERLGENSVLISCFYGVVTGKENLFGPIGREEAVGKKCFC
jgi:hypothetical protein